MMALESQYTGTVRLKRGFFDMRHVTTSAIRLLGAGAVAGLIAMPAAQAKPGSNGWQTPITFNVPTGQTDLFLHLPCPTGFSVQNGGLIPLTPQTINNGFLLTGNGPRLDEAPPAYNEWAWKIEWTAGGAQAGSQIIFNVLCKKGVP